MLEDRQAFMEWAKDAVAGLKDSVVMVAIWDDREDMPARMEFALQIGYCLLTDKPILVIAPWGGRIPDRLRTVATAIVEYDPLDFEGAKPAIQAALSQCVPQ